MIKQLLFSVFVVIFGVALFGFVLFEVEDKPMKEEVATEEFTVQSYPSEYTADYEKVQFIANHVDNTCAFRDASLFQGVVKIEYPEKTDEVVGTWSYSDSTLELMQPGGLNVRTVSHEVAHVVEDYMDVYEVSDPHFGPYMQGYLTECVWVILQKDIDEASQTIPEPPRFRFTD